MSQSFVSLPKNTWNLIPGQEDIANAPQKVLMVGQKTSVGSAVSGVLIPSILNDGSENALFGANSMLAAMVRAFKLLNKNTQLSAIPLSDNGAGVLATGSIAFTGPATAAGTLTVTIGSERNNTYEIAVASADTATVIGAALAAAITADTKAPVTAASVTGTVTFTAVHKGTAGNFITISISGTVTGVGATLTAMSGGTTNPVLTGVFDVVGTERYQTIVAPVEYGTTFLKNFLDPRFNATNMVEDGVAIVTSTDTFANLITLGNANNSQSLVIFANDFINTSVFKGSGLQELNHVISSYFAAIRSLRLTDGANISQFVIANNGPLDTIGGKDIASLPYFNTPIPYLTLIAPGNGFSQTEIDSLNAAGVSIIGNNITRTTVLIGDVVTTRKTDSAGNPEATFHYLNSVDTSSVIREYFSNNNRARFAQSRLTSGDLSPGKSMVNKSTIEAFQISLWKDLAGVLIQSGEDSLTFFKNNLTVTLDVLLGKVTITMKVPIVGQLREIAGTIQIVFSTLT